MTSFQLLSHQELKELPTIGSLPKKELDIGGELEMKTRRMNKVNVLMNLSHILWKNNDLYRNIVLLMGGFH